LEKVDRITPDLVAGSGVARGWQVRQSRRRTASGAHRFLWPRDPLFDATLCLSPAPGPTLPQATPHDASTALERARGIRVPVFFIVLRCRVGRLTIGLGGARLGLGLAETATME
jgi:hypothetical protein